MSNELENNQEWKADIRKRLNNWVKWAQRINLRRIGWSSENLLYRLSRYRDQTFIVGSGLQKEDDDDDAEFIDRAVSNLPDLYHQIIVNTYLLGSLQSDIALDMHVSLNTYKNRLSEAHAMVYQSVRMQNLTVAS